jgi:tRNA modification GTPase
VRDLVDAVTPLQARAAMDQLEGTLTSTVRELSDALLDLTARLEASLDFPDEGFHFITRSEAADLTAQLGARFDALIDAGSAGRMIREGSLVVLVGRPNAGKSSLFNALVGSSRAIVTEVAGTTRDLVSETVDISGFPVTLVDTAGIRDVVDPVEAEGVRRAHEARRVAALTLLVLDASAPLTADDLALARDRTGQVLVVTTKADLTPAWSPDTEADLHAAVRVSAVTGTGLEALKRAIVGTLTGQDEWRDPPRVSNMRHLELLRQARDAVARAQREVADGGTEEIVVAELTAARQALESVTGVRDADDVLRHIFSRFCVGK